MDLVEGIVTLNKALAAEHVPHAFGGALALAWCTQRARATIDIDVNLFVPIDEASRVLATLPDEIAVSAEQRGQIAKDGQTRLWWGHTPVDVFFNTTRFHEKAAGRARSEEFGGAKIPFLACSDLAVFKAFFNRTKDWADLEEMAVADSLDIDSIIGILVSHLGGSDERIERLRQLAGLADRP